MEILNEHPASFHIMYSHFNESITSPHFNKLYSKPFKDNKVYRYCFNNREFVYSNKAFDQKLDRIFENINNVFIISSEKFKLRNYDLFDALNSREANKFIMKELSEYIVKFNN